MADEDYKKISIHADSMKWVDVIQKLRPQHRSIASTVEAALECYYQAVTEQVVKAKQIEKALKGR